MKFLPLIVRHLRHNWVRTTSTVLAVGVCIFLVCTLQAFVQAIAFNLKSANDSRLVVRHNVSLVFRLPEAHRGRIAGMPGVEGVARVNWFGGIYMNDRKKFFPNFAVDMDEYLAMYPEYQITDAARSALRQDLRACIVGKETAERFGWKEGDIFQLESFIPNYRKAEPFEFVIAGIYDTDSVKNPGTALTLMLFHYKYLFEGTEERCGIGTFSVRIKDPSVAVDMAHKIDDTFENSDTPTKTETESAFRASFVSLGGNLALLLNTIGLAVTFSILLVTANTMAMAIRERRTEIGILKTLGFSNRQVLFIVLGEATLIGLLGGAVGCAMARVMIPLLPSLPFIGDAVRGFPGLGLSPPIAVLGFGLAVLLGFAAGLTPAVLSYRAKITSLLRHV